MGVVLHPFKLFSTCIEKQMHELSERAQSQIVISIQLLPSFHNGTI